MKIGGNVMSGLKRVESDPGQWQKVLLLLSTADASKIHAKLQRYCSARRFVLPTGDAVGCHSINGIRSLTEYFDMLSA